MQSVLAHKQMHFLLLEAGICLLLTTLGREMDILLCVLGKLLPQTLIQCSQWRLRLWKAKQLFYGVNGNVAFFRVALSSIFLSQVVISLSAYKLHPKLNVTHWS